MLECAHMRQAVTLLLLTALLAPIAPFRLYAEEVDPSSVPDTSSESSPIVSAALPADVTFSPSVPGTVLAQSIDTAWDERLWGINFAYNINIGDHIAVDGVMTHITLPLGYLFDAPDFPIFFTTRDAFGNSYDCQTPEKTMAEWGIYNNAQGTHWNRVTIGPFFGTECDTALRNLQNRGHYLGLRVLSSTGANAGGNLGTPGYLSGAGEAITPFIAYAATPESPTCTENCNSSVLFLPGLKGRVLQSGSETLWPADLSGTDFPKLALNEDGTSKNPVVVNGILPSFKIHLPVLGDVGPEIYSGFIEYMDSLVAGGTIKEWKPLAYDWRYSPDYIVSHDIQTPGGPVNLIAEVERMASTSHSRTGKVTIVAHSMGGLVGKALIRALEEKGEADLIDSFVMIGSPELGTPQAAASLLHGDQEGIPGKGIFPNFVATRSVVRSVGRDLSGAYSLLPSEAYFDTVTDPVITFDPVFFTQEWRQYFGDTGINSYTPFAEFLAGIGSVRSRPNPSLIVVPEVLRTDLLDAARTSHAALDTYSIPSTIRVVEIAGWGEETTKAIAYTAPHLAQSYDTVPTIEGDGVVVYPSAVANGEEIYYFDLFSYKTEAGISVNHGTLLNATPINETIENIITKKTSSTIEYISKNKPSADVIEDRLRVSTYSPVTLGVYDRQGRFTGVYPDQDLTNAYIYVQEEIPGSSFTASGDTQSVYLPKNGTYTFVYKGTGTGPTTVKIEDFANDSLTAISEYRDIPTTANTSATFNVDSTSPQDSHIQIDQNSDGQPDTYIAPDGGTLSLAELIVNLRTAVQNLSFAKPQQKTQLLNKIAVIEQKIAKQKEKQIKILQKLQTQISKKVAKGRVDQAWADEVGALLDQLISGSSLLSLDPVLIQELKAKITVATIAQPLKTSLLVKITRLENMVGIVRSVDTMSRVVSKKGAKGLLTDIEVQNLLNLLEQIQGAL